MHFLTFSTSFRLFEESMSLDAFCGASMDATRCPKPNERNKQREQVEATSGAAVCRARAGCVEWFGWFAWEEWAVWRTSLQLAGSMILMGPFDLRPNLNQEMQGSLDLCMTKKLSTNASQLQLALTLSWLSCIRTHCPSIPSISPRIRCKHNDLSTFSKSPTWTRLRVKDGLHGGCFDFCLSMQHATQDVWACTPDPSLQRCLTTTQTVNCSFSEDLFSEVFLQQKLGRTHPWHTFLEDNIPNNKQKTYFRIRSNISNTWAPLKTLEFPLKQVPHQFVDRSLEQHRKRRHRHRSLRVPEFLWPWKGRKNSSGIYAIHLSKSENTI